MRRKIFLIMFLGFAVHSVNGISRPGTWTYYFSYSNATKVVHTGSKVYCATEGGLFFIDLTDNSLHTISTGDGLSDIGIQTLAWHESLKLLMIVYKNSNIDLITNNRIINLGDIKRKLLAGDKTIYNILFTGKDAYLSCGFGVVAVNLERAEIKGTYHIGENGSTIKVFDTETDGRYLYAATERGILSVSLEGANLLDYNSWTRLETVPHANEKFSHLAMLNGNLMAVYTTDQYAGDESYLFGNGQWKRIVPEVTYFNDLSVNSDRVVATSREEIFVFDHSLNLIGRYKEYMIENQTVFPIQPRSAISDPDGSLWIGDYSLGLIRHSGQKSVQLLPSGPLSNVVFSLTTFQDDLWFTPGGRSDSWNNQFRQPVFQLFREGEWSGFTKKEFPGMTGFWDIVQVVADPGDKNHVFAASWGGGVLEFKNNQLVNRYNNQNSILQTAIPEMPLEPYTRIGGMAFDSEKTLWVTNSQSSNGLCSLSPAGEWKGYELTEISGLQFSIGQVIVTQNNDKWVVAPRGHDVYVVNKDGTKKKQLLVTSYFNNNEQEIYNRMNDVYSIAEDLNGDIWIGTSVGVAVFSNPRQIWQTSEYFAYQPSLELNDGLYHPLLETETVSAIVVDGANRKWLGTKKSGIYLVSQNGDREVHHFTSENSPLLSNNITSMALSGNTGELFVGTDKGLISYMTDAPKGKDDYSLVYAYPNPVRETYQGDITIAGLVNDSDVKITDVAGNLVFKGKSLGSKIIWDGKNLNGRRVSTGIYLFFCSDPVGEKSHTGKLLFIK